MTTVREAAEKIVIIQGGGDVDQIERQLQKQIADFGPTVTQAEALAQLGVERDQAMKRSRSLIEASENLNLAILDLIHASGILKVLTAVLDWITDLLNRTRR
jgi:hypothetical protein